MEKKKNVTSQLKYTKEILGPWNITNVQVHFCALSLIQLNQNHIWRALMIWFWQFWDGLHYCLRTLYQINIAL